MFALSQTKHTNLKQNDCQDERKLTLQLSKIQEVQPVATEDKILQNAINKLKIAFSLFPHFYKSYYPKIGGSIPATTIDLIR